MSSSCYNQTGRPPTDQAFSKLAAKNLVVKDEVACSITTNTLAAGTIVADKIFLPAGEVVIGGGGGGGTTSSVWRYAVDPSNPGLNTVQLDPLDATYDATATLLFPGPTAEGAGTKLILDQNALGAVRAGSVDSTQWDAVNRGTSSVAFGRNGIANGQESTVAGGSGNTASGVQSTVGGGAGNIANNIQATVGGGLANTASGVQSTVGGGTGNTVISGQATVGGGSGNTASGQESTVGGGSANTASATQTTIGGGTGNSASTLLATIGGGSANAASGQQSTIGGGTGNTASGTFSTVAGGTAHSATNTRSTVGGGGSNFATGDSDTVAGGLNNGATGGFATVAGGAGNRATGGFAFVGGGQNNTASGNAAVCLGQGCVAGGVNGICMGAGASDFGFPGCLVWNDTIQPVLPDNPNTVTFGCNGGMKIFSGNARPQFGAALGVQLNGNASAWAGISDRNAKENLVQLDGESILQKILQVPIYQYNYIGVAADQIYRGPVAQDWHAQFPSGKDPLRIDTMDLDGISLAAIHGLASRIQQLEQRIIQLESR